NAHERLASTRNGHHVALAQYRVRGCFFNDPVATQAQDEDAGAGYQRLGLDGAETVDFAAGCHAERTYFPAVPGRASTPNILFASVLLLVVFTSSDEIDADQCGAD